MLTKDRFILDVWERTAKEVVGAAELDLIQKALSGRFGESASMAPAAIARVLADHGVLLAHPQILAADTRWREHQFLFTTDDLNLETLDAALALLGKIESFREQFAQKTVQFERLRQAVRQLKTELQLVMRTATMNAKRRALAEEVTQWLTVWLQNPQIFADWLTLRRASGEFEELFGTFPVSRANTNDHRAHSPNDSAKRD